MNPRPGEVWLADLGLAAKTRPVVIVSRYDLDAPRALAIYVPLTTQNRNSLYEVPIPKLGFLNERSFLRQRARHCVDSDGPAGKKARKIARQYHGRDITRSLMGVGFTPSSGE